MCGGSKGTSTSTTTNTPPPEVLAEYHQIMGQANQVASQPYTPYTGNMVAGFTPAQQQGFSEVGNLQGFSQPYINQAQNYLTQGAAPISAATIQQYENPYTQQVVGSTEQQFDLQNAQQQAQLTGNTLGSGGLFNDRLGVAQAQLAGQQQTAEAPVIAGLESQGYTQGVSTALAEQQAEQQAAYGEANLGTAGLSDALQEASAELGVGGQQQQLAQENLNWPYEQYLQEESFPYQQTGWLAGVETGVGSNMGGSSTTTSTPSQASTIAPYLGLGMLALSDRRVKRDVKKIGELEGGLGIYRYRFEGSPKWEIGLMAQDVERKRPRAVHDIGGLKHVDIKAATDRARGGGIDRPHRQAGGVAPGAFPFGSQPIFAYNQASNPFPYAGGNGYVPAMQIHGGSGLPTAPAPPSGAQQNPLSSMLSTVGSGSKAQNALTNGPVAQWWNNQDVSTADAQAAALAAGDSPEEVGLGDLEAFRRGGHVMPRGIHIPRHIVNRAFGGRSGFDDGGPIDLGDDLALSGINLGGPSQDQPEQAPPPVAGSGLPAGGGIATMAQAPTTGTGAAPGISQPSFASLGPNYQPVSPTPQGPAWPGEAPPPSQQPQIRAPQHPELNPEQRAPNVYGDRRALSAAIQPGTGVPPMPAMKYAIGTFESGRNYNEIGPMTKLGHALGYYQVMEKELPAQLKQAGLPSMTPQQFLRDHDAQDRVFETVFGGLVKKYGNFNDAASVWFSGKPVAEAGNRKDVLGTTVPAYLANTNALLRRYTNGEYGSGEVASAMRDDAGRSLPRRGDLRLGFSGEETNLATGEVEGNKGFFGGVGGKGQLGNVFGLDDKSAGALRMAGLALLANRSPYLGQALGDAGIAAMGYYNKSAQQEAASSLAERKQSLAEHKERVDESFKQQQLRRLDSQIQQADERLKRESARDAREQVKADEEAKERQFGKPQAGERWVDPNDRSKGVERIPGARNPDEVRMEHERRLADRPPPGYMWRDENDHGKGADPIPGGPQDPAVLERTAKAKRPAVAGMSPEQQEVTARQIVAGNTAALTGFPRTVEGLAQRNAVRNQAIQILMTERGMGAEEAAAALNRAEQGYKSQQIGLSAEQRTAGTRAANLDIILRRTNADAQAAIDASEKVTRYGGVVTPLNRLIQNGQVMTSQPEMVEFGMANLALAENWAKAMNPTGVMRESDRDLALRYLDTALSKGTYERAVHQLQAQIGREMGAVRSMRGDTPINQSPYQAVPTPGGGSEERPATPGPAPIPGSRPAPAAGRPTRILSGQDQQALGWAQTHPGDPRAAQILQRLGAQ